MQHVNQALNEYKTKPVDGIIGADEGNIKLGSNVVIGYYDQEHQVLEEDNTLFEEISDAYPDLTNTEIRNTLAAFLFTNDDVFKKVRDLSGGEQGRLCLAKLMLSECNFLILDEPTNHLDIVSKEILEKAISGYEGTCFYISHDRYFVNKTATRILELENKSFTEYLGNYDYYLEKKEEQKQKELNANLEQHEKNDSITTVSQADWKASKEQQAQKRKQENDLKRIESSILECENKKELLESTMSQPEIATNSLKLQELSSELNKLQTELDSLYEKWEQLM